MTPTNIKATQCNLTDEMRNVIDARLSVLEKFVHDDQSYTLDVEVEKTNNQEANREYRGEVNLTVDGTFYRAEAYGARVEDAFDSVREELRKELNRAKGKRESLFRKGARRVKDIMRFGRE